MVARRSVRAEVVAAVVAAVVALLLGGLTSFAQGWLPRPMASLANSVSGWTLPTVVIVGLAARRLWVAAVLGAACFLALVAGYVAVSGLRGHPDQEPFWAVVGLFAGPVVGIAVFWVRRAAPMRAGASAGLLAGIGVGEGFYGLTRIADHTSPVYWTAIIVVAVVFAVVVAVRNRDPRAAAVEALVLVVVAALGDVVLISA